jgi:hypothetical protein
MKYLDRLLPARWRQEPVVDDEKLYELFSGVEDTDRCLQAVMELLGRQLKMNWDCTKGALRDPAVREECLLNAHLAEGLMELIETTRAKAKEWRQAREQER